MPLLSREFESGLLVEVAGSVEFALRPEDDFLVTGLTRKADTFRDQLFADA
jgi:hypothetical protein